jgi:hypothetical protein
MFNSIIVLLASLTMSVLSLQCAPIEVRTALGCTALLRMAWLNCVEVTIHFLSTCSHRHHSSHHHQVDGHHHHFIKV